MIFHRDFAAAQNVCPQCGHHMRIGAKERFAALFDGEHETLPAPEVPQDPLRFRDDKRYVDRLKENRAKTGQPDALTAARGKIAGVAVILAVQNFSFMGGSLGLATGAAFVGRGPRRQFPSGALSFWWSPPVARACRKAFCR